MLQRPRRDDGAPEQQRPRDRTGRPLPYDTEETLLAEDHAFTDVEDALSQARVLWNAARFFEAHECLEVLWHAAPEGDRDLWQGVIQVAVAQVHRQRNNPDGARMLYRRARTHLEGYTAQWRGVDVTYLHTYIADATAALHSCQPHPRPPRFPDTPTGAWFAYEAAQTRPSTTPTPVPERPRWLAEGVRRVPQRRATG